MSDDRETCQRCGERYFWNNQHTCDTKPQPPAPVWPDDFGGEYGRSKKPYPGNYDSVSKPAPERCTQCGHVNCDCCCQFGKMGDGHACAKQPAPECHKCGDVRGDKPHPCWKPIEPAQDGERWSDQQMQDVNGDWFVRVDKYHQVGLDLERMQIENEKLTARIAELETDAKNNERDYMELRDECDALRKELAEAKKRREILLGTV